MSAPPKPDTMKSTTHPAETSLMTPAQHRAVAARLRRADPGTSGEDLLAQLKFARLHDLVADAIENRDRKAESQA